MRPIIAVLIALFILLQYQLWFSAGGILPVYRLNRNINRQTIENQKLKDRNTALLSSIDGLKHGTEALEEHARSDLGMIKKGEMFYQVVK